MDGVYRLFEIDAFFVVNVYEYRLVLLNLWQYADVQNIQYCCLSEFESKPEALWSLTGGGDWHLLIIQQSSKQRYIPVQWYLTYTNHLALTFA